jgi:hypothetical protein
MPALFFAFFAPLREKSCSALFMPQSSVLEKQEQPENGHIKAKMFVF